MLQGKFFCKLALLRRLKLFLDSATLNTVYKALIQPHFDYCSLVWYGRFNEDVRKLDVINKRCMRSCHTWCEFIYSLWSDVPSTEMAKS